MANNAFSAFSFSDEQQRCDVSHKIQTCLLRRQLWSISDVEDEYLYKYVYSYVQPEGKKKVSKEEISLV